MRPRDIFFHSFFKAPLVQIIGSYFLGGWRVCQRKAMGELFTTYQMAVKKLIAGDKIQVKNIFMIGTLFYYSFFNFFVEPDLLLLDFVNNAEPMASVTINSDDLGGFKRLVFECCF